MRERTEENVPLISFIYGVKQSCEQLWARAYRLEILPPGNLTAWKSYRLEIFQIDYFQRKGLIDLINLRKFIKNHH